jgi:HK97 family phage major capsid protein
VVPLNREATATVSTADLPSKDVVGRSEAGTQGFGLVRTMTSEPKSESEQSKIMKPNLMALRQKKHDLAAKARAILDRGKTEARTLTDAEGAEHSNILALLNENEAGLIRAEQQLEQERSAPGLPHENALFARLAGADNPCAGFDIEQGRSSFKAVPTRRKYADLFGRQSSSSGFRNFGEFLKTVHFSSQVFDPRLKAGATESVPSDGGFLVPSEFSQTIIDEAMEGVRMRGFTR